MVTYIDLNANTLQNVQLDVNNQNELIVYYPTESTYQKFPLDEVNWQDIHDFGFISIYHFTERFKGIASFVMIGVIISIPIISLFKDHHKKKKQLKQIHKNRYRGNKY